jgi:chromosome segregation ATPase
MSALRAAEARANGVLERLEQALRSRATDGAAALERECAELRQQCASLRRDLAAAAERAQRLDQVVTQAEERIDEAIGRVDGLAGAGATS